MQDLYKEATSQALSCIATTQGVGDSNLKLNQKAATGLRVDDQQQVLSAKRKKLHLTWRGAMQSRTQVKIR